MAPIEFIGRYMPGWFDYTISHEIHQLTRDTAQGNALGTLSSCTNRIVGLTEPCWADTRTIYSTPCFAWKPAG
jgi:hypothetical protein